MRKFVISLTIVAAIVLPGCATTPGGAQGSVLGGAFGAIAGAVVDGHNPWRGAVIGAAGGAAVGGAIGDNADIRARQDEQRRQEQFAIEQEMRRHPPYSLTVYDRDWDGYKWRRVQRRVNVSWYPQHRSYAWVNLEGRLVFVR